MQNTFLDDMWWLNAVPKSRQHGLSTIIQLLELDTSLFNKDQTCGIVDKTDNDAKKKLAKIRYAYDNLDYSPEPGNEKALFEKAEHIDTSKLGAAIKEAVAMTRSNDHELEFSNDSKIWTGTSLRGGTCQFLHISELGPIAFNYPAKAEEIRAGALNTVHVGSKIVIESTHEGGRYGLNYEMIDLALKSPPREQMTQMDWQLHFFAWWQDPKNSLQLPPGGFNFSAEHTEYFRELDQVHGIQTSREQRHWYVKKELTQKGAMLKEHPSTLDEALNAAIQGAIYGKQLVALKKKKRVYDFEHDSNAPFYTFWDIGKSDYMSCWLIQPWGRDFGLLNYFSWFGEGEAFYMAKIHDWEREYDCRISHHFFPHDVSKDSGPGLTWEQAFREAGMKNLIRVPVTPDVWIGIKHMRGLFNRCWIHHTNCSVEWPTDDGRIVPSGLSVLEGYRTKIQESGGKIDEMPVHDECSHGADALRTFAEAHMRGMLPGLKGDDQASVADRIKILTGVHGSTEVQSAQSIRRNRIQVVR